MGVEEAKEEIMKEPSPKLWRILGEAALETLNLDLAEEAFIHCKDYYSIKTITKVIHCVIYLNSKNPSVLFVLLLL